MRIPHQDERESQRLTPTQLVVLELVAGGLTSKGIAARLALSPATVETHVREAMKRLGARTRVQAAAFAQLGTESPTHAHRSDPLALQGEEHRLLRLMATGATVSDAALALHLSRRTCARRLAAAKTKLGAQTTAEAILRAAREQAYKALLLMAIGLHAAVDAFALADDPLALADLLPF